MLHANKNVKNMNNNMFIIFTFVLINNKKLCWNSHKFSNYITYFYSYIYDYLKIVITILNKIVCLNIENKSLACKGSLCRSSLQTNGNKEYMRLSWSIYLTID